MSRVTTRANSNNIMEHILQKVMQQQAGSSLEQALKHGGFDLIEDVLNMSTADIDDLAYVDKDSDGNEVVVRLLPARRNLLRAFQAFIRHLQSESTGAVNFLLLNPTDFNEFRIKLYDPNAPMSTPSTVPHSVAPRSTAVSDFKKSIKRDKSHYTTLREDKQWDAWRRSTLATARSHSCEEVFDPSYVPTSLDDKELFIEKQKFVYSVFEDKLQTDVGKALVRDHEHDSDAQTIFAALIDHAKVSTQATIDTAQLLKYITTVQLHDSLWKGTTHSFILHWCDKVRIYEGLVPKADHFTSNLKMIMLQNTVSGVPDLHRVQTQSAHDVAHGKPKLTFESYKVLLMIQRLVLPTIVPPDASMRWIFLHLLMNLHLLLCPLALILIILM